MRIELIFLYLFIVRMKIMTLCTELCEQFEPGAGAVYTAPPLIHRRAAHKNRTIRSQNVARGYCMFTPPESYARTCRNRVPNQMEMDK